MSLESLVTQQHEAVMDKLNKLDTLESLVNGHETRIVVLEGSRRTILRVVGALGASLLAWVTSILSGLIHPYHQQ
jgi:hypothetical protein